MDGALQVLSVSPWFGLHPGGWAYLIQLNPDFVGERLQSVHSMYLGLAVDWGLPLLGLFVLANLLTIKNGWTAVRRSSKRNRVWRDYHSFGIFYSWTV